MASEEDLAEVMQNALESNGDLALLHVQVEEKVASLSARQSSSSHRTRLPTEADISKPSMPNEVFQVNELIREYFKKTGCKKTASVFVIESGLPAEPLTSLQLRKALVAGKISDTPGPLLSIMVDHLKKK